MKLVLALSMLALMLPGMVKASTDETDEDGTAVSLPERITLLKKVSKYRGRVEGTNKEILSQVKALLKNEDQIADLEFNCDRLNPLTDDKGRMHILDCSTSFIIPKSDGKLAELNFGTAGWEAETAKITDVTARSCGKDRQKMVDSGHAHGKVLACIVKHGPPMPGMPIPPGMPMPIGKKGPPSGAKGLPVPHSEEGSEDTAE